MRFVEETGAAWTAEQLRVAEAEIEAQKREWEANRLAALQKEEELLKQEAADCEDDLILTYSRKDANNQVVNQSKRDTTIAARSKRSSLSCSNKLNKRKVLSLNTRSHSCSGGSKRQLSLRVIERGRVVKRRSSVCVKVRRSIELNHNGAISIKQKDISLQKRTPEQSNDQHTATRKSSTGVKNQKLLRIARRKHLQKLAQTKKTSGRSFPKRRLSVLSATNPNNLRILRNNAARQRLIAASQNVDNKVGLASVQKRLEQKVNSKLKSFENDVAATCADAYEQLTISDDEQPQTHLLPNEAEKNDNPYNVDQNLPHETLSMDDWNALAPQMQDTATNSTYYNVSEESEDDSDENNVYQDVLSHRLNSMRKSMVSPNFQQNQQQYTRVTTATTTTIAANVNVDVNSPRTRSRGSVKIDLWTLDVSPVLPSFRTYVRKESTTTLARSEIPPRAGKTDKKTKDEEAEENANDEEDDDGLQHDNNKSQVNALRTLQQHKKNAHRSRVTKRKTSCSSSSLVSGEDKNYATLDQWVIRTRKSSTSATRQALELREIATPSP